MKQIELIAVILTGMLHIALELNFGGSNKLGGPETIFNFIAALGWSVYLAWRIRQQPGLLKEWGFGCAHFRPALIISSACAVPATIILYLCGPGQLTAAFWLTLLIYPVWGIVQQFALQVLITRNLGRLINSRVLVAVVAGALFGLAHYPNYALMSLTLPAGIIFSLIYQRHPNLWAIGTVHGLLGTLAFYLVLGEDPGAAILKLMF